VSHIAFNSILHSDGLFSQSEGVEKITHMEQLFWFTAITNSQVTGNTYVKYNAFSYLRLINILAQIFDQEMVRKLS
jgi:hypothetical protein